MALNNTSLSWNSEYTFFKLFNKKVLIIPVDYMPIQALLGVGSFADHLPMLGFFFQCL